MNYNLENKTIIITGANSGIGKAAAILLAKNGANIILACRSLERGKKALEEISRTSESNKVELFQLDLASQDSIRKFAALFKAQHSKLDVLIHNAANFDLSYKKPVMTENGVETIFATNHIGPVLLTHLLLDLLKKSAPSRIITVASKGLVTYPFMDIEFDNLNGERKFSPQHAYYQSKQAQVMFTYDMAEELKGTGVTINCVRVTNVALPDEKIVHLPSWQRKIYGLKRKMAITPEQQAETYVYLAADTSVEEISGGYWDEQKRLVKSNKNSYNRTTWKNLRKISNKMAGIVS